MISTPPLIRTMTQLQELFFGVSRYEGIDLMLRYTVDNLRPQCSNRSPQRLTSGLFRPKLLHTVVIAICLR